MGIDRHIGWQRLVHQRIAFASLRSPAEVVRWLGAVQAQDLTSAYWTIGARCKTATHADVDRALADRLIVRTWAMRGTLHFLAAEDIRWITALLGGNLIRRSITVYRARELDDEAFAPIRDVLVTLLEGGQQLSRPALFEALEARGIRTTQQRGYNILTRASLEGLICHGVPQGKQPAFTLLDDWLPPSAALPRDEALARLAERYFTSRGLATVQDFSSWASLTLGEARQGLEAVKSRLMPDRHDGVIYWRALEDIPPRPASPSVHLLPGFDEFYLGYKDRTAVIEPDFMQRVCPGANGVFYPTVVIDGVISGTWKRALKKDTVIISAEPFTHFSRAESDAIAIAAERYGDFLGLKAIMA